MILQTMTPEEKLRQSSRIEIDIRYAAHSWVEHNQRMLKMRKTYPFVHIIKRNFKDMGTWNIILSFPEKPNFRKGFVFSSNAYQKFYVTHAKDKDNIGVGVYFIGGSHNSNGVPTCGTTFYEFTPHFLNRYCQRFLGVNEREDMSFHEFFLQVYHDISVGVTPDPLSFDNDVLGNKFREALNIPRVAGYDNLMLFIHHGLCLGFNTPRCDYICFLTYVGRNDFFHWQREFFKESKQLLDLYDKLKEYDPYCFIDKDRFCTAKRQYESSNKVLLA